MTSRTVRSRSFAAILGTLALFVLAGCTETNTEYVERPQFNPPPDSVTGYMGYYNAATQQTTCGNCHSGYQGDWVDTKHADAYDDLVNSGHAAAYCFGCHTVSDYGNTGRGLRFQPGDSAVREPRPTMTCSARAATARATTTCRTRTTTTTRSPAPA